MTSILLALAAAAVMGWASVAQQHVASGVPVHEGGAIHLVLQLLRHPLWLAAFGANLIGFALHSWALDLGSLLTVEPVIATTLLFALAIGTWWSHRPLGTRVWVAAALLVGGLAVFLVAGDPSAQDVDAPTLRWLAAGVVLVPVIAALWWYAHRHRGPARAITFGITAGVAFGVQASLLKASSIDFGSGIADQVDNWKPYAMLAFGVVGFLLQQSAFQAGPISLSLPSTVVIPPIIAAVLSVLVFDSTLNVSGLRGLYIGLAMLAMLGGLIVISRAEARRETAEKSAPAPA